MNEESQLPSIATLEIFSQNDNEIHLAYNLNEAIIISNLEVINNLIIHGSEQIIFIKSDAHIIDIVLDHVRLDPNSQLNIDHITIIDHKINYPLPKANKHLELIAKIDPNSIVFSKLLLEQVKGVNLIPGSGEFVYDTLLQNETKGDLNLPINYHQHNSSDAVLSIKQLKEQYKQIKWIAIIVSWFGNSTDTEKCLIYPAVEALDEDNCFKPNWCVAGIARDQAWLVSKDYNGNPNYGGTPDDVGLIRYLDFLRQEGFKILFYPMIFLDVPNKPWRGHLTGTYQSVDTFFTKNSGYNHFILHYANLVKDKVDGFIIGSELTGLTKVSDELGNYPAVQQFIKLAGKVKNILGAEIIITYAADWSEYHHANDGMRPLDELWASDFIDVVGIDAYFPITNALRSNIDANLIFNGWTEGEGYQYYYDGNRNKHQLSNDWAWKDLAHWWQSEHYDSKGQKTKWQPKQKKIWFTEFGFPSIDKATNQPNTFFNPECIDGGVPKFSDGSVDYDIQKKALVASLMLIADLPFIENSFVWCFDARAYPTFPLGNIWSDNHLWPYGHWLNGKHDLFSSGNIRLIEDLKVPNLTVVCNNLFIDKSIAAQDLIYLEANVVFKNDILRFIHGFKIDLTIPINISSKKLIIKSSGDIDFNEFILQSEEQIKIEANKITLGKNQHLFKLNKRTIKLPKLQLIKTDNLSIKCSTLTIHPINFEVSDLLLIEATEGAVFLYHKYTQQKQVKHGSKTTIRTSEDFINNTSIKAKELIIRTDAELSLQAVHINVSKFLLVTKSLDLDSAVSHWEYHESFKGTRKKCTGKRRESSSTEIKEICFPTLITADDVGFDIIENFISQGSLLNFKKFSSYAKDYFYLPKSLATYSASYSKIPHGLLGLGGAKSKSNSARSITVFASVLYVDDTYYGFAENEIFVLGSIINAEYPHITAKGDITFKAALGKTFHHIKISKTGIRTNLRCGGGEFSLGLNAYHETQSNNQAQENIFPSMLIARQNLYMKGNNINQISSHFVGERGAIEAQNWKIFSINTSRQINNQYQSTSVGVRIGIQESISRTLASIESALDGMSNINNSIDVLNSLSRNYQAFRNVVGIMTTGGIRCGAWFDGSHQQINSQTNILTPEFSNIDFNNLNVHLTEDLYVRGAEINGADYHVRARNIIFDAPQTQVTQEISSNQISGQLDLIGNIGANINLNGQTSSTSSIIHHLDQISVTGHLSLIAENNIEGSVQISAEEVDIEAERLRLISPQDIHQQNILSGQVGYDISGKTPNIGANHQTSSTLITENQTRVNATQLMNINVKHLELQSAQISNINPNREIGNHLLIHAETITNNNNTDSIRGNEIGGGWSGGGKYFGDEISLQLGHQRQHREITSNIIGSKICVGGLELDASHLQSLGIQTNEQLAEWRGTNHRLDVTYAQAKFEEIKEALGDNVLTTFKNNFVNAAQDSLLNTFGLLPEQIQSYFGINTNHALSACEDDSHQNKPDEEDEVDEPKLFLRKQKSDILKNKSSQRRNTKQKSNDRSVVFLPSANDGLPVGVTPLQTVPNRPTSILFSQSANDTTRMAQQLFAPAQDRPLFGWGSEAYASPGAIPLSHYINVSLLPEIGAGIFLRNGFASLIRFAPVIGGAVLSAQIVNNAAEFQSRHPAMNINPLEVMSNPLMSDDQKRQVLAQLSSDPLTKISKPQASPFMDIDPNAGRPSIFSTPWYERGPSIESFPDGSDLTRKFGNLPGFGTLDPLHQRFGAVPGFEIHQHSWQDSILFATIDPEWNIRPGQEWKEKIIGKAQKTGTPGHDIESYKEAIKAAKRGEVDKVYLDRGISNKALGLKKGDEGYIVPNRRPDVTIVNKDGTIDQIEVGSKTDIEKDLLKRMQDTKNKLPEEKQGEVDLNDTLMKKYQKGYKK